MVAKRLENEVPEGRNTAEAPEGGWGYLVMLGVAFGFVRRNI